VSYLYFIMLSRLRYSATNVRAVSKYLQPFGKTFRAFASINQDIPTHIHDPVIVINPRGEINWESYDSKAFVSGKYRKTEDTPDFAADRTVYTVTRTVDSFRLFEMDSHFKRLAFSSFKLLKKLGHSTPWADHEELRIFAMPRLRSAIPHFYNKTGARDLRITMMLTLPEKSSKRMTMPQIHIEPMPFPPKYVHVFVRQGRRSDGESKSLAWKTEAAKQKLLDDLPDGVNEVVMVDEKLRATEGISSNFAAMQSGKLVTAPISAGILPGTIRSVLMNAYQGQIVEQQPDFTKILEFAGAFLLSTSRLCVPINMITLDFPPIERKTIEFDVMEDDVQAVCLSVKDLMKEHSELLSGFREFHQDNDDMQPTIVDQRFEEFKRSVLTAQKE